jgi:hypothetical protein
MGTEFPENAFGMRFQVFSEMTSAGAISFIDLPFASRVRFSISLELNSYSSDSCCGRVRVWCGG